MSVTMIISIIGLIGIVGCIIWLIVTLIKKKTKKFSIICLGISAILFLVGCIPSPTVVTFKSSNNTCNVKYEDVSNMVEGALYDMGVSGKPENIKIESSEISGIITAEISLSIENRKLTAACFKDDYNQKWYLSVISGGEGSSYKCYWLADSVKNKQDLYDIKTDKLISKKSE